jgi:uracil-DNA glycosylase
MATGTPLKPDARPKVEDRVRDWRRHLNAVHGAALLPLPHPSWRNSGWLKRNPWFAQEILPELRRRVRNLL